MPTYVAVDLGATSGRVVNVHVGVDTIDMQSVSRFDTVAVEASGSILWDTDALLDNVRRGIVEASRTSVMRSVGIDSWAVDYGLFDEAGRMLGPVHSYRSDRTAAVMDDVCARVGRERIYGVTGIQFLPFNTIFQLVAARDTPEYSAAAGLLMLPDVINHDLCGSTTNDVTNASTTQLLDATTHEWSDSLIAALGLRRELMPTLHEPCAQLGRIAGVHPLVDGVEVVAVASHDTASAVAGTPLRPDRPGIYISCGTWSLVGCELRSPVTSAEALAANVTNELGVDNTTRLLKNITGLWLLERLVRDVSAMGAPRGVQTLVAAAAEVRGGWSVIDPDDPLFAAPGSVAEQIANACRASGQHIPQSPAETTRVILDSLALAWRRTVRTIERVGGFDAEVVHLVGGGSANRLLGDLCASACERPVLVGPTEATVVGNALVQAVADGVLTDIAQGRALVERAMPPRVIRPSATLDWDALERRLFDAGIAS